MPKNYVSVHVKRQRGKVHVIGYKQTPRGQKYISGDIELTSKVTDGKIFKDELATAVEQLHA